MVGALLLALVGAPQAEAAALTLTPTAGVVGGDGVGVRPGLRLGFEPVPQAAIELMGDMDLDDGWDAGVALAGRSFLVQPDLGEGLYLLGRFTVGMSGDAGDVGSWTGLFGGFGVRPTSAFLIEASAGPEWAVNNRAGWRTELSVGLVFGNGGWSAGVGSGNVRHGNLREPG